MQGDIVESMVIEPALVVIEGFAVIAVDNDNSFVHHAARFKRIEECLNTRVHISDCAIVLRDDIILIGNSLWHPRGEIVAKRFE